MTATKSQGMKLGVVGGGKKKYYVAIFYKGQTRRRKTDLKSNISRYSAT